jgi:hypothetical protein
VTVTNGGGAPIDVAIGPSDPNQLLAFDVRPNRLSLRPGENGSSRLQVTPGDTFLTGPQQNKPFVVKIESTGQLPFELPGALLQSARLPSWLPRAGRRDRTAVIVGGFLFRNGDPAAKTTATPTPSEFAEASSPSPTPSPTPTPPPTAPPSTPATPTPPPPNEAPTPTAAALIRPGTSRNSVHCGQLQLRMRPACEGSVKTALQLLAAGLGTAIRGAWDPLLRRPLAGRLRSRLPRGRPPVFVDGREWIRDDGQDPH